jgi:hypothetical protein
MSRRNGKGDELRRLSEPEHWGRKVGQQQQEGLADAEEMTRETKFGPAPTLALSGWDAVTLSA